MDPKIINQFNIPPEERLSQEIGTYIQNGLLEHALEKSKILVRQFPDFWQGYAYLAHIIYTGDKSKVEQSLELLNLSLYKALCDEKHHIIYRIYFEIAIIYKQLRKKTESLLYHRLAIDNFNKTEIQMLSKVFYGYAATCLLFGDYKNGFDYYRYAYVERDTYLRGFAQPFWWGEDCRDGVLFLHNEQAYGDLFFFFRYIKYLKPFFKKIVIEAPPRLIRILKSSPLLFLEDGSRDQQFEFYPKSMAENNIKDKPVTIPFDYHTHFALLPRHHKTTLSTIPVKELPIFRAENELVENYKGYFDQFNGKMKIGINWCGKHTNEDEPHRRLPYKQFVRLAKELGDKVQFFSIQKIYELDKINEKDDNIINLGQHLDNEEDGFIDTAAVMSLMDLVISSDTGIVHLAGGLGVKTWVLVPALPEWRWGLEGNTSPWYPKNFRLFRKQENKDWDATFDEVLTELKK